MASAVAAEWSRTQDVTGTALVLGDPRDDLSEALRGRGSQVVRWNRLLSPGQEWSAWPPAGLFDQVWLRLPRSGLETRMLLTAAADRLAAGGTALVYGPKDEGIRSVDNHRPPSLAPFETVLIKRRCRVLTTHRKDGGAGSGDSGGLEEWAERVAVDLGQGEIPWLFYPGVFAHGRVDPATRMLIQHLPPTPPGSRVLDFGAGTGVIAKAVLTTTPEARVDLLEPDAVALAAAAVNVPEALALEVATLDEVPGPYDLIVSNPPIHEGKAETLRIFRQLAAAAGRLLAPGGRLVAVIQRRLPVEPILGKAFRRVQVLADEGPFRLWQAHR